MPPPPHPREDRALATISEHFSNFLQTHKGDAMVLYILIVFAGITSNKECHNKEM